MIWLSALAQKAILVAAGITGKKFALMVGSSLIATTGIVAAGLTSSNDLGPLAALVGRSLAANQEPTPAAVAEEPEEEELEPAGGESEPASSGGESPSSESFPAAVPAEPPEASEEPEEEAPAPEEPAPEAGQVKHVFVLSLASPGYEASWGTTTTQMPYLTTTLRPQGDLLSNFSLLAPASLPNSIATLSGQPPTDQTKANCPEYGGCVYPAETLSLADQLGIAQFTWRGYIEGMVNPETGKADNCVYPQPGAPAETAVGGYTATLNPFVYFHSLLDLGECAANDVPATELEKDLKKVDSTPNYSYVSPSPCNTGIPGQCIPGMPEGAAAADAYLSQLVPKILASPAYKKDGVLIVTFGAANPTPADPTTGAPAVAATNLKVGTLLVSPFVTPGATDGVAYDPYSLLKSTEDLFGLDYLEKAKAKKIKSFAPSLLGENGGD